jgi:hypothetical protein
MVGSAFKIVQPSACVAERRLGAAVLFHRVLLIVLPPSNLSSPGRNVNPGCTSNDVQHSKNSQLAREDRARIEGRFATLQRLSAAQRASHGVSRRGGQRRMRLDGQLASLQQVGEVAM